MLSTHCFLASVTLAALAISSASDPRVNELSRIKEYELVHFDFKFDDQTNVNLLEFTAFGNEYLIELIPNLDAIPSSIHHTNGIPDDESSAFFTALDSSCHFNGKVVSDSTDPLQRVALSLCPNRGVRGDIRAFNETLYIKPSRYFLDLDADSSGFHDVEDEHLVFRHSDYDHSGIPELKGLRHIESNGVMEEEEAPSADGEC